MNRQEKRRRRRRRKAQRMAAWAALIFAELVVAAAPAVATAAALVPICRTARGNHALGWEWILVWLVFTAAYAAIHNAVCNKLEEEGQRG